MLVGVKCAYGPGNLGVFGSAEAAEAVDFFQRGNGIDSDSFYSAVLLLSSQCTTQYASTLSLPAWFYSALSVYLLLCFLNNRGGVCRPGKVPIWVTKKLKVAALSILSLLI